MGSLSISWAKLKYIVNMKMFPAFAHVKRDILKDKGLNTKK